MNCSNPAGSIRFQTFLSEPVPVVLGLGSNRYFGTMPPVTVLFEACRMLSVKLQKMQCSSIYITKPMYYFEQDDFYNMVVSGWYSGDPESLLADIHSVEDAFGRNRNAEIRNGPRPLDIDIELFGQQKLETSDLVIPHPRMTERAFVLIPMLEIFNRSAESINISKEYYQSCLDRLPDQGVRRLDTAPFVL